MPAFSLIIKGSAKEAIVAAERRRITVLRIHHEFPDKTVLIAEASGNKKIDDIYRWFNDGPVDAPYPVETLLSFSELTEDVPDSGLAPARGTKILDGLSEIGDSWTVSTLKPGLHGQPSFRHQPDEATAVAYARNRALHGERVPGKYEPNLTGRVYFVLNGDNIHYRVFRGLRGEERRSGSHAPEPRREFIIVQRGEVLPNGKYSWKWDHGLSIEIEDPELVKERARKMQPATKSTRYAPGWAFKPPPKVRSR